MRSASLLAASILPPLVFVACAASTGAPPPLVSPIATASTPPAASSTASSEAPPKDTSSIQEVWKSRCGNCHTRVEPGTRTRDAITAAMERHHRRVRLRDEQWAQMIDFLAPMTTP